MKNKKTLIAVLCLLLVAGLAAFCWFTFGPQGQAGAKTITVDITHADGVTKTFVLHTDAEFLSGAMEAEGLLVGEEGPYGLYVKAVDGEPVDDAKQEWWGYTKGGEYVEYGVDMCPIADGDHYEFTFNVGYDF